MSVTFIYIPRVLGGTLIIPASPTHPPNIPLSGNINISTGRDGLNEIGIGRDSSTNISIGRDGGGNTGFSR